MRLIQRAFDIAKGQAGVREVAGTAHNPRIIAYHTATDLKATTDEVPWCSSFVNWCVQQAGGKGTRSAAARSWLSWGRQTDEPQLGDVVILSRGASASSGHVGFFAGFRMSGGVKYVRVFGGNQSNMVNTADYAAIRVLGYRTSRD
jgi:uncharacterized protein (TIGR02594 family)